LSDIRNYLEQVEKQKLPVNHQIIYQLQDIFNLLPDVTNPEFVKALFIKTNDQMLVVYASSLCRSIIALHNLINNKLANREAEKKELAKKEEKNNKEEAAAKKEETNNKTEKEKEKENETKPAK
jgi:26S proteasome regulatory subunit N8